MKTITYHKYGKYNSYKLDLQDIDSDHPLGYLAEFLMEDLGMFGTDWFIEWLEERNHIKLDGTNWPMYQILLEDGIVELGENIRGDNWEEIWDERSKDHFKISREKMIDILKRYKEVRSIRPYPNKIVFTQGDNGDVTINAED